MFEDVSALTKVPPAPEGLGEVGQRKWEVTAEFMIRRGTLTGLDLGALELYCSTFELVELTRTELEATGISIVDPVTGRPGRNPKALLLQEQLHEWREQLKLFGSDLLLNDEPGDNPIE